MIRNPLKRTGTFDRDGKKSALAEAITQVTDVPVSELQVSEILEHLAANGWTIGKDKP